MTWLIFELWGLFLAAAALGAIAGYTLRGWLSAGKHQAQTKSAAPKKSKGVLEGKVIHTTAADMVGKPTNQGNSYPVEQVEGIGKTYAKKLRSIGVRQTHDLLDLCRDTEGRDRLAKYLKVHTNEVKRWTSMSDLMRVGGIGGQFAELLEAADVSSIEELMQQKGDSLSKRMAEINAKTPKTRQVPDGSRVGEWVKQAKKMKSYVNLS